MIKDYDERKATEGVSREYKVEDNWYYRGGKQDNNVGEEDRDASK